MSTRKLPAAWETWFAVAKRCGLTFGEFFAVADHLGLRGRMHNGVRYWSASEVRRLMAHLNAGSKRRRA